MRKIELRGCEFALVDNKDYELVIVYSWQLMTNNAGNQYAVTKVPSGGKQRTLKMHRLILGLTDSKIQVDHISRNGLDNQRHNLRIATRSQNNGNQRKRTACSSNYKGVWFDNTRNKWMARITENYVIKHLGRFETEIEAAKAYNKAALEFFGEYALLNEIE